MENAVLNDATEKAIEDLWSLWAESDRRRDTPPAGSRTAKQYGKLKGIPEKTAADQLRAGEAKGSLKSQIYVVSGHLTRFYWPVETKCPESKPLTSGRIGKKRRISG